MESATSFFVSLSGKSRHGHSTQKNRRKNKFGRICRIEELENREMLDAALVSTLCDICAQPLQTENNAVIVDTAAESNQRVASFSATDATSIETNAPPEAVIVADIPVSTPLPAPTEVKVTASTVNTMTVEWKKVNDASGYTIEYSTVSTFPGGDATKRLEVPGSNITSHTISDLQPGTEYFVRVTAVGTGDYSDSSPSTESVKAETKASAAVTMQTKPSKFKASKGTATIDSIKLEWAGTASGGFMITFRTNPKDSSSERTVYAAGNSTIITGLQPGTTYKFTISALNERGDVGKDAKGKNTSATVSAKTVKFAAVKKLKSNKKAVGLNSITLEWKAAAGADGYKITVKKGKTIDTTVGDNGVIWVSKDELSKKIEGLAATTKYTFEVQAYTGDPAGDHLLSAVAKTTTSTSKFVAVKKVNKASVSFDEVKLTWAASNINETTGYVVEWYVPKAKIPAGTSGPIMGKDSTETTIKGLNAGTKYTFTVYAFAGEFNPADKSNWSMGAKKTVSTKKLDVKPGFDSARQAVDMSNGKIHTTWDLAGIDMSRLSDIELTFSIKGTAQYRGPETDNRAITATYTGSATVKQGDAFTLTERSSLVGEKTYRGYIEVLDNSGTLTIAGLQSAFAQVNTGSVNTNFTITQIKASVDGAESTVLWSDKKTVKDSFKVA